MDASAREFFFGLLRTPSPSGFEMDGQRTWAHYVEEYADHVDTGTYGSTWAELEGTDEEAPRLMIEGHADEIGFMVNHITDEGFLHVRPIGGSDRAISRARRVRVLADDEVLPGVTGNTAIHLRDRDDDSVPEWQDIFIDIGADSRDEVLERGVRVGHPVVSAEAPEMITERRLAGRAIDNRLGGFIVAQALKRLADDRPAATVVAVNSVQEELGGHGARMITHRLEPDLAVVFDVTHSTDSPGIDTTRHGQVKMGEGPTLTHGTSNHPRVIRRLMEVAEAEDISLQHEASSRRTGTDTDSIFTSRAGVPSGLISVPLRYMHSMAELVDTEDIERCVQLFVAFARSLEAADDFSAGLQRDG